MPADRTLFAGVQSWIKNALGSDYGGRFFAQVIMQVARADPQPIQRFLASFDRRLHSPSFRLEAEEMFSLGGRTSRADLVAYAGDIPVLLVELKYRDRLAPGARGKSSQLTDYLRLCRNLTSKPSFVLIHRDAQDPADIRAIRAGGQSVAHYGDLVPFLQCSENPVTGMLLDYLREEGMVIDPIDTDRLFRFFHRLVLPWGGSGRVNVTSQIQEGPLQFQRLLSNLRLVSSEITPHLRKAARQDGIRSATIDFSLVNEFDGTRLRKLLYETNDKVIDLGAGYRKGGLIDVYAQTALVNYGSWLYINYGFEFHVHPAKELEVHAYATVLSPDIRKASGGNEWDERFIAWNRIPKRVLRTWRKGDLEKLFLNHIRQAARSTLKSRVIFNRRAVGILRRLAA